MDMFCVIGTGVLALLTVVVVIGVTNYLATLQQQIIRLETVVSGYRAALRYYADEDLYVRQFGTDWRPIESDKGKKAREMLGLEDILDRAEAARETA